MCCVHNRTDEETLISANDLSVFADFVLTHGLLTELHFLLSISLPPTTRTL